MPIVTPHKMLLIAAVIGLGAIAGSIVQVQKIPGSGPSMFGVLTSVTSRSIYAQPTPRTPKEDTRPPFLDRTPFPYVTASGPLHRSPDVELEY